MITAKEARQASVYMDKNRERILKNSFLAKLEKNAEHRIRSTCYDSAYTCHQITLLLPFSELSTAKRVEYAKEFFEKHGYNFSYNPEKSRFYTISW